MTKKTKIMVGSGLVVLLAGVALYLNFADNSSVAAVADNQNLEAIRQADQQAQTTAAPPVKFNELPAKPPSGRREPTQ